MKHNQLFSVGSFAKLSRSTRDTLYHYDDIGVLPPASRGANNYRYYSSAQLPIVNLIRIMQELGMSLDEIIEVKDKRSPEFIKTLLAEQVEKINGQINTWTRARKLLSTLGGIISSVDEVDEELIEIKHLPAQQLIMGPPNDFSRGAHAYDALLEFYEYVAKRHPKADLNYPVWGTFSKQRVQKRDWVWPDRYYFYNPEGKDSREAGLYAVAYARGSYGQTEPLYERAVDYIHANGYQISGDSYEEYPLNELVISDPGNYLIRLLISVSKSE